MARRARSLPLRPRARPIAVLSLCLWAAGIPALAQGRAPGPRQAPAAERPAASGNLAGRPSKDDLVIPPPAAEGAEFRFLPEGPWLPFDRPLVLGAAPGEERAYQVETRWPGSGVERRDYLIDKLPPPPPRVDPPEGLYDREILPRLSAEAGDSVHCLLAEAGKAGAIPVEAGRLQALKPPARGQRETTLIAWAVDAAGNRSLPLRAVYKLAAEARLALAPRASMNPDRSTSTGEGFPALIAGLSDGRLELGLDQEPEGPYLIALSSSETAEAIPERFFLLPAVGGRARLQLDLPWGWKGVLFARLARKSGSALVVAPAWTRLELANLPKGQSEPVSPAEPTYLDGPPGTSSWLFPPPYAGEILLSLDGGPFVSFAAPIEVKPGAGELAIAWKGRASAGSESPVSRKTLPRPKNLPTLAFSGVEDGAVYAASRRLSFPAGSFVRYQLLESEGAEPELGASAPLAEAPLSFSCPEGEERRYRIALRAFSSAAAEAEGGESKVLAFAIDRKPPPPPKPASPLPAWSPAPLTAALVAAEGRLRVRLAVDGVPSGEPASGTFSLPGSPEGARRYRIEAWTEDAAGNRSVDMSPIEVVVDLPGTHLDSSARPGGDGSPSSPYRELATALAAAERSGKSLIRARGDFSLARGLRLDRDLRLEGGYGPDWKPDAGARARLVAASGIEGPLLLVEGAKLELRRVDLVAGRLDPPLSALAELRSASLAMSDSSLTSLQGGAYALLKLRDSRLSLLSCEARLDGGLSAAFVSAEDSPISIEASSLEAGSGLGFLTGVLARGGSLSVSRSLVASRAGRGSGLFDLDGTALLIERSKLSAEGSGDYLRILRLAGLAGGELRNSRIEVAWAGDASLIECEDPGFLLSQVTALAASSSGRLAFIESKGAPPLVRNSYLAFLGGGGRASLFRAGEPPGRGSFPGNALWGFDRLLDDRPKTTLEAFGLAVGARPVLADPERSLVRGPKGELEPPKGSPLADAGVALAGEAYARDFSGRPRPGPGSALPDIGADEGGR